jgi:hypothetical protein
MAMLSTIRDLINRNRLYSWMAVFVIMIQALILSARMDNKDIVKEPALSKEEFKRQIEQREEALRGLAEKDPKMAMNMGLISLFIIALTIGGTVFLTEFITKKRKGIDVIPRLLYPPDAKWNIGDVVKIVILFLFYQHLFLLFVAVLGHFFQAQDIDRRLGIILSTGFMDILVFMFILRFVVVRYRQKIKALGISFLNVSRSIGVALYSYVAFLPVIASAFIIILTIARFFNYIPPPEPVYELIFEEKRPVLLVAVSFLISAMAPVVEEVFFRGFLYAAIRKRFTVFWSIFLSAFLFSLLHTNLLGFLPILLLGMFLAYLREKTGSLMPCIVIHVVHNTALSSMMFFIRHITSNIT